jgi:L-ascorbate metabolism protein UlaG (beta-lactamase superfamily)
MRNARILQRALLGCATALLLLLAAAPRPAPVSGPGLELTYLGNEGVRLRVGAQEVAIDALHRAFPRPPHYEHLPPPQLEQLETARGPFGRLRVHLTTHVHADHFHGVSVARFLAANRDAVAVVPREAPAEVCPGTGDCAVRGQLRVAEAPERELTVGGVHVTTLALPHAKGARTEVDNVGYLVTLDGVRVLHVGDAHLAPELFAPFRLPARRIDVALVPYWYLLEEEGPRGGGPPPRPRAHRRAAGGGLPRPALRARAGEGAAGEAAPGRAGAHPDDGDRAPASTVS